jgi:hypothetical protein
LLLTLYVIGTYMDRDGFSFPSQGLIAKGARASIRTVKRHIAAARAGGWLGVEPGQRGGKGWRHNVYRAAVPESLPLPEKHEEISDAIRSQVGDPDGGDTAMAPPMSASTENRDGGARAGLDGGDKPSDGGDTASTNVGTQLWPPNSYSETPTSITPASEEAQAKARAPLKRFGKKKKPEELEAEALLKAQAMAASIGFREIRPDECPRRYAVEVVRALAGSAA